jgi:hypothetical protein
MWRHCPLVEAFPKKNDGGFFSYSNPEQSPCLLFSDRAKNTAYRLIGDVVISCYFSKSFALVNPMENSRPVRNANFPMRVKTSRALFIQWSIGWMIVNKKINFLWEELCKRNK